MMAYYKLQKIETEVIVLTYHDYIDETSELLKDLKTRYVPSVTEDKAIKIVTFPQLCNGNLIFSLTQPNTFTCRHESFFRAWNRFSI